MKRTSDQFPVTLNVPARILAAFTPLLEAVEYAEQTASSFWDFAVEQRTLLALGLTLNDFRWLVRNGLVEHKREVTLETNDGRAFQPTGNLMFPDGTCFVLTPRGISLLRNWSLESRTVSMTQHTPTASSQANQPYVVGVNFPSSVLEISEKKLPCWNPERRLLTFNGTIVKHFKWAAENQEAILSVFEEEGWPDRVDDPLTPSPEQDSKRRLSDTIKCLNRKQSNALIHFRGDGTGEGVVWERA